MTDDNLAREREHEKQRRVLILTGGDDAPGLKRGGVLTVVRPEVELVVTAGEIPEAITVDLAGLDIGDTVTISSVNLPEVALPEHEGCHRLLHIHRNVPGIMSAINGIFSDTGINVSAQYLQTNEAVGYVVIDIDAEYSDVALARLSSIDGTIRCRVLF